MTDTKPLKTTLVVPGKIKLKKKKEERKAATSKLWRMKRYSKKIRHFTVS